MITLAASPHSPATSKKELTRVLFLGEPQAIALAYPESSREALRPLAQLESLALTVENWSAFPEITSQVELILATWGMPVMDESFLAAFPKLQAVFYAAGSVKSFITSASEQRPVIVCGAAEANAIPVAEYTVSAVMMSLKHFWSLSRKQHRHAAWSRSVNSMPGAYRSVVGLISLGATGRAVAQRLARQDVQVIAFDPFVSREVAAGVGVTLVANLDELFRHSDVVSLHAPLLPETRNLIGEKYFKLMKPGATFINTSRGAIVNEADLCRVFHQRPDLTAILDVTWPEPPLENSPLYELNNIVITPHIAGSLGGEVTRMGDWMMAEARRYLLQQPLQHQINSATLTVKA